MCPLAPCRAAGLNCVAPVLRCRKGCGVQRSSSSAGCRGDAPGTSEMRCCAARAGVVHVRWCVSPQGASAMTAPPGSRVRSVWEAGNRARTSCHLLQSLRAPSAPLRRRRVRPDRSARAGHDDDSGVGHDLVVDTAGHPEGHPTLATGGNFAALSPQLSADTAREALRMQGLCTESGGWSLWAARPLVELGRTEHPLH